MGLIKPSGSKISYTISPSDEQRFFSSVLVVNDIQVFVPLKTILWLGKPSTIRIKYRFKDSTGGYGAEVGLFINNVLVGSYQQNFSNYSYIYIKQDITVKKGDEITLKGRGMLNSDGMYVGRVACDEFGVYYGIAPANIPVLVKKTLE
ncbi:hypothetical protein [Bacillus sp. 1P06AnD]|uniref:hypothetical protein n=1 Tax=Bacillus sp. 1P06AnD TaxID=3132208 RepID=UPI0039A01A88